VTATVEDKIPEVIAELLLRAQAIEARRLEQEKLDGLYAEERQRAVERARDRYLEDLRAQVAQRQVARWEEAQRLRAFVQAMRARTPEGASRSWLDWVEQYASQIDPQHELPAGPELPQVVPDNELRDYLKSWPYERPYRWRPNAE